MTSLFELNLPVFPLRMHKLCMAVQLGFLSIILDYAARNSEPNDGKRLI